MTETLVNGGYFLSPQQKNLWLAQQGTAKDSRSQIAFLLKGLVEAERLRSVINETASHYEILRTVFRRKAGMKIPFQVILDRCDAAWEMRELSSTNYDQVAQELLEAEATKEFDFERGPLVRALLAKLDTETHILALTFSPLCADSYSLRKLGIEILRRYAGHPNPAESEPLRYVQFSQWQSELLEGGDTAARDGKAFWSERMRKATEPLNLPFERKSEVMSGMQSLTHILEAPTLSNIEQTAAGSNTSVAVVVLTAWQSLLSRLTTRARFMTGVIFNGREYEELSDAVGLIAKMLPIPVQLEKDFRFLEILGRTRDALAEAAGWQEYFDPSAVLGTESSVAFHSTILPGWDQVGGIEFRILQEQMSAEPCKLRLFCAQGESRLRLEIHYHGSRFAREDIQRLAQQLEVLLEAAVANPQTAVSRLPLMSEVERERILVEWNKTESAYPAECIHKLFEQQVARVPDRTAVRCEEKSLSYRELNEQSNRLAHALRKLGVGPDSLVAVLLDRSVEMMVAVLAILKAGGAYVPLNTDNPKARLQQQLDGVAVLLTQLDLLTKVPEFGGETLCLDGEQTKWNSKSSENPELTATPEDLAYVIYTSGSTGVPKGVAVRHRNLVNYAWFIAKELKLWDDIEGLQFASVSTLASDLGNTCIYPALISGGCLHLLPYEVATDAHRIALYQDRYPIDVLKIVPSHLAALLNSARPEKILPRKYLITGGETLTQKLVSKIAASDATCQIINHYGPTETTVGSLIRPLGGYECQREAANIPIGRPIANTRVYVLDEQLQPVPVGVTGELYIAGAGVTAGYLGQPERTEEHFLVDPFATTAEARMYRTGDMARYLEDGNVEFLGRVDDQVKVRGFRIELGEIEAVLHRQPGVKQAVVLAREDEEHEKQLVGYVVADREQNVAAEELRKLLKEQLPEYMVPAALILLEKLPLTSNGKVDRMALPKPEEFAAQEKVYLAPSTPTEQILARIWIELLQCPRVSVDANFFELGGHSLTATQVISRVREQFAVEIAVRTLFETPTLGGLAAAIDMAKAGGTLTDGPITRASREVYIEAKLGTR